MRSDREIRDEELLLLGLCRLRFSNEQVAKLNKIASGISDWEYFVRLACDHGIPALVLNNLKETGLAEIVPANYVSVLRNSHLLCISRNAFHISSTEELLSLLAGERIKCVLIKGLGLELTVYGNKGLRQMTDVDILVDRNDYLRTRKLMMANGYDSLPLKSGFHKPIIAWTGKHLPSLLKNGTSVDIHIELFGDRKNDLTKILLSKSVEIALEREKVYIPPPQLHFLYLVKHLYSHELNNESQLRLYADLVVLLESYFDEIINYDLIYNAAKAGIPEIVARKLEPLRDLWGIRFPEWVNDYIDKWFNPASINKFVFFLKSPKGNKSEFPGKVYRNNLKQIPGLHRKLLFILGDIFPTVSFMKERYGVESGFRAIIRYPLRLGKLGWLIRR